MMGNSHSRLVLLLLLHAYPSQSTTVTVGFGASQQRFYDSLLSCKLSPSWHLMAYEVFYLVYLVSRIEKFPFCVSYFYFRPSSTPKP